MKYTHVLKGSLSDIDEKYKILPIIGLLLIFSIFHLLIYKFIFKNMAISNFKEITKFETDVDMRISNIIETKYNNNDECSKFFDLLTDTSKRNELDTYFSNKVKTIKVDNENSIRKYLMMYNIYMYFQEYLYMNDVMKDKIKKYFGIANDLDKDDKDEEVEQISFIGLLDSNERKLLKAYHEELPFHKLVSKEYIEDYQQITEEITSAINSINKYIIKYTGTFFPFLITCIYICIICVYNIYTLYILFKFINKTELENIFATFIYSFSHKYIYYCEKIYSIFFNK
jgi:predicted PurR-regulated permease PerM